jgi:hypothetical protein
LTELPLSAVHVCTAVRHSTRYYGTFINDDKKPNEKGELFLVQCETDNDAGADYAEMIRAVVKVNPSKGTGSLSGVSIAEGSLGNGHAFRTCKYKFKLTGLPNPNVPGCPL